MKEPVMSLCSEALFRSLFCSSHSVGIFALVLATFAAALSCYEFCVTSVLMKTKVVDIHNITRKRCQG